MSTRRRHGEPTGLDAANARCAELAARCGRGSARHEAEAIARQLIDEGHSVQVTEAADGSPRIEACPPGEGERSSEALHGANSQNAGLIHIDGDLS